ncbi:MAG: hypothetical protein R6U91_05180 [Bacillota bacterium]
MRGLKKILLLLISVIVIITGWVYLAGLCIENTMLSSSYYHDMMEETELASSLHAELKETLPDMIAKEMTTEMEKQLDNTEVSDFEQEVTRTMLELFTKALADTFDEDRFEDQLLLVIDDLIAFIKGEQQELTATIDIKENKEDIREKMTARIENLPPPVKERMEIPDNQTEKFVDEILTKMNLPDQIHLNEIIREENGELANELEQSISTVQSFRGIYLYLPYITFALMLMSCILLAGLSSGLKWFGAATIFFSATFLLGIHLFPEIIEQLVLPSLESELPLNEEMHQTFFVYTLNNVTLLPLISGAVGLVLLLGGWLSGALGRKK